RSTRYGITPDGQDALFYRRSRSEIPNQSNAIPTLADSSIVPQAVRVPVPRSGTGHSHGTTADSTETVPESHSIPTSPTQFQAPGQLDLVDLRAEIDERLGLQLREAIDKCAEGGT
ncbi:MAG TPA: hypothetical protein VN607_02230, partial [Gemmatimonadaceae bacterium]|nr:hypothetical protein [Gemmatimonadaceae bacterium]